jgi:hypothetical protein
MSPEQKEIAELKESQKKIQDALDAAEAEKLEARNDLMERQTYEATSKFLTDGLKGADGQVVFDHSPYRYSRHMTAKGRVDAPRLAMDSMTEMVRDLGRAPTDAETGTLLTIAFDKIEADLKGWAEDSRGVEEAPPKKTETTARPKDRRPTSVTAAIGRGGQVPVAPSPKDKLARKAAIVERLRTEKLRERAGLNGVAS